MKVSSLDSHAEITRQFAITEDNPVVGMAYSSPPKQVIIDRGTIRYIFRDGRWIVKDHWAITVVGDVLKQNGERSKNTHKRDAQNAPNTWKSPELVLDDSWAWLQPIIDLLRPNGDLSMMILNEAEVG